MESACFRRIAPICLGVEVAVCLILAVAVPSAWAMKCRVSLEISEEYHKIVDDCVKSNSPNYTNYPDHNATVEEYNFDDNCFRQCVYKAANLLTPEGTLKKDQAPVFFKASELDKETLGKVSDAWNKCWDDAEKIGKNKGFDQCKALGMHEFCTFSQIFEGKLLERKC